MGYTALITGASTGLGAEFARQLAAMRVDLVLVARDEARLSALAAELEAQHGVRIEVLVADLTDPVASGQVAGRLSAGGPRDGGGVAADGGGVVADRADAVDIAPVDILINNAGFGVYEGFERSALDDERRMHELLSWAPLRLAHAAIPGMLARRRGWIMNVASVAAFTPTGSYGSAKAAIVSLSRSLNARYRGRGVRVSALCPGLLDTEFHERMGEDHLPALPRIVWADTTGVAREGLRGLYRGRSVVVSDWRYRMLMPFIRVLPDRWMERVSMVNDAG
ncbi:SDR family NAD(P)-dependent oxidoreductase [Leucobacter sp. GX24907]